MKVRIIALLVFSLVVSLLVMALLACTPQQSTGTAGGTRFTAEIAGRASSDVLDQFIALLESADATILNEGQQPQGMFDDAIRWQLFINDTAVNVYEFSDAPTRRAISDNISPDGSTLTLTEGDTQVVTHWDFEAYPYFWGYEALLVQYAGQDSAVIDLLNQVLGAPLADGSRLYRQETPGTGIIAGIGEYGVSFQYDPYLAASLEVEVVPGLTAEEASGFTQMVTPDHLVFTFVHTYAGQQALYRQAANLDAQPHIAVYPAETYAAINELAEEQVESLRSLLIDKPLESGAALPLLPTVNAAQALQAQIAHLTFLNGSGVRYLAQVAQEARPVNNQELFYTFQGLTDDGAYYVAAFFPVSTAILPDDAAVADDEAFNAGFADYLAETRTDLDGLSPADFTPNLSLLDAVVASLSVEPDLDLFSGQALTPAGEPTPLPMIAAPAGLVYSYMDGLWRIEPDGQPRQLLEVTDYRYLLPAPDLAHAVYMDDDGRLWLVDLANGSQRQLADGVALAWLYQWGDARTLLLGVWLNPGEEEGNSTGHLATLDIESGELRVVDDMYLSLGRPALAPDGQTIAYDVSPFYTDVSLTGRLYHPDSGSQAFDLALFEGLADERPWRLSNPAWSPDGTQLVWKWSSVEGSSSLVVFDLPRQTATTIFTWQPKGFGALPPSPTWSPDGQWLAIEIWANNEEESGLWLLMAGGSTARRISASGSNPHWLSSGQLIYADCELDQMCTNRLYDPDTGETAILDMPSELDIFLIPVADFLSPP